MNRFVFLVQYYNESLDAKMEKVAGVKTFGAQSLVNSEAVFNAILKLCLGRLDKFYSVTSDTTRVNTGRLTGIKKRFERLYLDIGARHSYPGMFGM